MYEIFDLLLRLNLSKHGSHVLGLRKSPSRPEVLPLPRNPPSTPQSIPFAVSRYGHCLERSERKFLTASLRRSLFRDSHRERVPHSRVVSGCGPAPRCRAVSRISVIPPWFGQVGVWFLHLRQFPYLFFLRTPYAQPSPLSQTPIFSSKPAAGRQDSNLCVTPKPDLPPVSWVNLWTQKPQACT